MFALIISFNLIAVNLFNTTEFIPFGPLFTLPFVAATSYAIVKYRLLEIRWVIVRTLLFTILSGGFFVIYGLVMYGVMRGITGAGLSPLYNLAAGIVGTAVAVAGFHYFRTGLEKLTNRFLFKGRYDYRQTLLDLGESLSQTIDLDRILTLLTETLRDTVKVDKVLVFLRDGDGGEYTVRSSTREEAKQLKMTAHAPILRHLAHRQGLLVRDELNYFLEQEDPAHDATEIREIKTAFTWLDVALVIPLVVKGEIIGLVLLGDKLSGDPFSSEDLELLATLAPQAATAIENARLYREAQEFGRKLEAEIARATVDLRVANERLAQLDKAKSEFLSIASHQLYTPLTAIRGYLSMILEGDFGKPAEKLHPVLDILAQSSNRLIDLIRTLLDVSRIESGRLELSLESVDFVALAEELVRELKPNAQRKSLTLTFRRPGESLPHVVADPQRLRQVLLNLVDNAIKYTDVGHVDVRVSQKRVYLVYAVQDTGKGIDPDESEQLFAKFSRVGGADRYHTEGAGLGLYFARQVVREHHGDIWVESAGRSKGSTFFVQLPIEGSRLSLKPGTKVTVGIKAAEAGQRSADTGESARDQRGR